MDVAANHQEPVDVLGCDLWSATMSVIVDLMALAKDAATEACIIVNDRTTVESFLLPRVARMRHRGSASDSLAFLRPLVAKSARGRQSSDSFIYYFKENV